MIRGFGIRNILGMVLAVMMIGVVSMSNADEKSKQPPTLAEAEAFIKNAEAKLRELDRLWEQVRPLYLQLHAYVRWKLREKYGYQVVPASGPIPADLLGNM